MANENRRVKGFIPYEYKEVSADLGQISFLIDGYVNFGWEIDENFQYAQENIRKQQARLAERKPCSG